MEQSYSQLAESLMRSLRLAQPPVAVCFADAVPESVPAYEGHAPAGCRFWRDAATAAFATSSSDHALCAVGSYTHNLELSAAEQGELQDCLTAFGGLGYVTPEDLPLIPVLGRRPKHVLYAPLAQSPCPPETVLLFGDASQALIVSEAVQQVEHRNPPALGRPACAVIPQVVNTGLAALSLGCCGARAYVDTFTTDLVLCALPGANLAAYVERIAALAQANSVLTQFHQRRSQDVAAGESPTVKESLAVMNSPRN
ncbi:MAG TPA: DUF169 domain-containing protein [Terracidiphilus sp.]|nr:DUF169 domain-containing protein [Terracidiphilus sp.]